MKWYDLIFSMQLKHRSRRHLLCCLCWWIFIILTVFYTKNISSPQSRNSGFSHHQFGLEELGIVSYSLLVLLKSFLLVITHILFCYAFMYVILPFSELNKRFVLAIAGTLLAGLMMIPVGYFLYSTIYPLIDEFFHLRLANPDNYLGWRSVDACLVNAIKLTLLAVAVKLLKGWWLKQKEKEQLDKEKVMAELQLLKAQIHPAFLFNTLNNIISHAQAMSPKAPEMIIRLSDLLSYMLYECNAPKVQLDKEIAMIREYMQLEKLRQGERLEMTFQVKGETAGQFITPLLLLPFIDNSFSYSSNDRVEQAWVNLDITIDNNVLLMKLINGVPVGFQQDAAQDGQSLKNVHKRLDLLYPNRYELKYNAEQELLMVHLHLILEQADDTHAYETDQHLMNYAGI